MRILVTMIAIATVLATQSEARAQKSFGTFDIGEIQAMFPPSEPEPVEQAPRTRARIEQVAGEAGPAADSVALFEIDYARLQADSKSQRKLLLKDDDTELQLLNREIETCKLAKIVRTLSGPYVVLPSLQFRDAAVNKRWGAVATQIRDEVKARLLAVKSGNERPVPYFAKPLVVGQIGRFRGPMRISSGDTQSPIRASIPALYGGSAETCIYGVILRPLGDERTIDFGQDGMVFQYAGLTTNQVHEFRRVLDPDTLAKLRSADAGK